MKTRLVTFACVVAIIGSVCAFAYAFNNLNSRTGQVLLDQFEFRRNAAPTTEAAAQSLFLGIDTASPRDFFQHLQLGVCNNATDVLQDFAEAMHTTQFNHNDESFTYYEMFEKQYLHGTEVTRLINRKKPIRVMASAPFDISDPQVKALALEATSTYSGERFVSVELAGLGSDGREYRASVVVVQVNDGWYAIPRCRNSKNFYKIADAMSLAPTEA